MIHNSSYTKKLLIFLVILVGIFCLVKTIQTINSATANVYIDEVRFYNRVLSVSEIAEQYRAGAGRMKVNTPITLAGPQGGLVGNWTFNGQNMGTTSAIDLSGNSKTGWLINGVTKVIGQIGQALQFDGTSAYVDAGNVSTVKTVAFWIKADGTADTTYFKGKLDEVRMYSRALSADEISQLYKVGAKSVKFGSKGTAPALSSVRPTSKILDLNSTPNTANIEVISGDITANGFTTPIYYVDGVAGARTIDNNWRFVAITTGTNITADAVALGKAGAAACTASVAVQSDGTVNHYSGTSFSDGETVASATDANTAAFFAIIYDGAGATGVSCTFNGAALTSAGTAAHNSANNLNVEIFWLMNPPIENHTLACTGTNVSEWYVGSKAFTNVNATTPVRSGTYQTGTGNSLTITSNVGDYTVTGIEASGGTTNSDQTYAVSNAGTYSGGIDRCTTPAASVTHTWTASGNYAITGLSVQCK